MKKFQNVASKPMVKKLGAVFMVLMICCTSLIPMAFATGGEAVVDMGAEEAAQGIMDIIHTQLNFSTVMEVIGVGLATAVAIFLGWWGIRKLIKIVMNAFKKGKVSI